MLPNSARLFLETTSLRGVGKVVKTPNKFLSRLWALFVLGSSTLLFYSVFKITADYLQYDVNIQTYLDIDDATPFPAVSICNNQPFSKRAYRLWAADQIQSPTDFNRMLRDRAFQALNDSGLVNDYTKLRDPAATNKKAHAQNLKSRSQSALLYTMVMDSSRMYYQNLRANESKMLGHERQEAIVDCIFKFGSVQAQGTRGCIDDMILVTEFSDPNFFNCMTIEFSPTYWKEVFSLTLIMWLGPDENYDIQYRQGFLYDVFEQAYGLRVAIHEPGSPPRILEQGMQTEPGKMNEIKYHPVKFIRVDTPRNPCIGSSYGDELKFPDLQATYNYDLELCLNSKVQEVILQRCHCLYIELPRIAIPNATHPYCGFIDDKLRQRSNCLRKIDQRSLRKAFESSDCLPKCMDLSFDKELSMTKWRDTQWMLHWIKEMSERWNQYFKNIATLSESPQKFQRDLELVKNYLRYENITDLSQFRNDSSKSFKFDDRYTFLVVKRETNNTLVKKEKIVLTLNALFSRIGGLCSMYMGLTLAFFMECIELVYKLICDKDSAKNSTERPKVVEVTEQVGLMKFEDQTKANEQREEDNVNHQLDSVWIRQNVRQEGCDRRESM